MLLEVAKVDRQIRDISRWQLSTVTLSVSTTLITETPVTVLQYYCNTAVVERLSLYKFE